MRTNRLKIACVVAAMSAVVVLWIFFAPLKLGGSTTYSVTSGISMQPLLYKNDLAVVRTQSSYHLGDIVLYNSPVLHKQVLHRIILVQNGNYFFKGDNNGFVDPGYATRSELVGKLWFHVPAVGAVISWFAKPLHSAFLAGLAAAIVVLSGFGRTEQRGRRRNGASPTKRSRPMPDAIPTAQTVTTSQFDRRSALSHAGEQIGADRARRERRSGIMLNSHQLANRRAPGYFEGPTSTLVALGLSVLLAFIFLGIGFTRSAQRVMPLAGAYHQSGTFSYSAVIKTPTAVYPLGTLKTGDPIYPALVKSVTVRFVYRFASSLPHRVKGTIELRALLLSQQNSWQQLSVVKKPITFNGDGTSIISDFSLSGLYPLINSVAAESGVSGVNYSADIQPLVHLTGVVANKKINLTFAPVLPFVIAQNEVTLDVAVAPAPPGATYVLPDASSEIASTLNPEQVGSVPHLGANAITLAKYTVKVQALRLLGLIFTGFALAIALLHDQLRRRKTRRTDEEQIARELRSLVVPVLELKAPEETVVIADFAHLARLAQFLERPILYELRDDQATYAVDDGARQYRYRSVAELGSPDAPVTRLRSDTRAAPATATPSRRPRRSALLRGAAGLVLVLLAATFVTSFTASTNVPTSNVGQSIQARQISELAPTACSTLALSSIVTGSGTFSNSASHALILGTSGVDKITDHGAHNCIVGGAGKDTVNGVATDVCIIGPTAGAAYHVCTKST